MRVTLDSRLAVSPDAVHRELDGEAVILHLGSGRYFGLDAVGTRVWALLCEEPVLRRVYEQLLDEYAVSPKRLEADLLRLFTRLAEQGLVEIREVDESA